MTYMVFDVESIGLHGEGFAVGYVVIDEHNNESESGLFKCDPRKARGTADGLDWVQSNVVPNLTTNLNPSYIDGLGSFSPRIVRERFWERWIAWKKKALLVADCPWPVEARFLHDCINDNWIEREWQGPYPFIDVASIRLAANLDPLGTEERLPQELPVHNPLADARQSARLFIEALNRKNP